MSPVQDTKRSQNRKQEAPTKKKTVPLPLEIVFRPEVRGVYKMNKGEYIDEDGSAFQFTFEPGGGADEPVEDPWLMRREILEEDEDTPYRVDGLTLVYGRFGVGRGDITVPGNKISEPCHVLEAARLFEEEYMEWRALIRAGMTTNMSEWPTLKEKFPLAKVAILCQPMALSIEWRNGRPTGIIICSGILQALVATLQIDALIGAEYRFCACVGCPKSFKVKRKDQRYCDDDCKHRQVVRNGRNRERNAANQPTDGGKDK